MYKIFILIFLLFTTNLFSQLPGADKPGWERDTSIIFKTPRPLLDTNNIYNDLRNRFQLDFAFSVNGFGFGLAYGRKINESSEYFFNLMISELRATDELEFYDWNENRYLVPNKINRLMMFPVSAGYKRYLFQSSFEGNLKPYISGALTLNYVMSRPYRENRVTDGLYVGFFDSFNNINNYFKYGGYIEVGFDFSPLPKQSTSIMMRYYIINTSEKLESLKGAPVTNFWTL